MNLFSRMRYGVGIALAVCLLAGFAPFADAQKVPISFDDYHGYNGTVEYLKDVADAYRDITDLMEIGRSNMGRPIYVLVISDMDNATTIDRHVGLRNMRKEGIDNVTPMKSYHGKPGQWIDGGTHGNEYTGTEVTLYIIDKLLTGYDDSDAEIRQLIADNAFYFCPIVNPDGVYNSVERGISQRQNTMEIDNDDDGRINEDPPDDINGDGRITRFRYKDDEGRYVMGDDPRIMVRYDEDEHAGKQRYSVVSEGSDNDGDGKVDEDGERGIDVNRNFPEGWFNDEGFQGGSGYYQGSSPEAHAILEFFTNNTNILLVQSFHTSGGFTYRPFARWDDSHIEAKDLAVFDRIMGVKYLELHDAEIPEAWKSEPEGERSSMRQRMAARQAGQRTTQARQTSPSEMPRLWRQPHRGDRAYGYGIFIDWAYAQFGSYSMTTELWNWQRDTKLPGYNNDDDRVAWEKAALDAFGDKWFVPWESYNHPVHGQGEIGGWISTYSGGGNAFPGESLLGVAETHWQFELFKANLLPKVEITEADAEVLYTAGNAGDATVTQSGDTFTIRKSGSKGRYKIVKVTATVENTGKLATHRADGEDLAGNREDVIWLIGDRNRVKFLQGNMWEELGVLEGTMEIPGYTPLAGSGGRAQQMNMRNIPMGMPPEMIRRFMQQSGGGGSVAQSGNTSEITWLIAVEGDTPLKLVLSSQKGGTKVRELSIR